MATSADQKLAKHEDAMRLRKKSAMDAMMEYLAISWSVTSYRPGTPRDLADSEDMVKLATRISDRWRDGMKEDGVLHDAFPTREAT